MSIHKDAVIKRNLYEVLQVHPRAEGDVIRASFNVLSREQKGSNSPYELELNHAIEILGDPVKRLAYDKEKKPKSEGTIIGEYRLLKYIAEGAIGETYLAEHLLIGEKVCVKHCSRVSPQAEIILFEEAKAV